MSNTARITRAQAGAASRLAEVVGSVARPMTSRHRTPLTATGDFIFDFRFPLWFTEKPSLHLTVDLGDTTAVAAGTYPIVGTPLVAKWATQMVEGIPAYRGASVLLSVTGSARRLRGELVFDFAAEANVGSTINPEE